MICWSIVQPTPDTVLQIGVGQTGICSISFAAGFFFSSAATRNDGNSLILEAARQLRSYFQGELRQFDLPLELQGTPFQKRVWQTLLTIPYGKTISYADLAKAVSSPKGFRAVGAANGKNPVPIIVPCHRVIESNGGLGGFSCGIELQKTPA
jgi:methylated-DNA-[protein]-cysteine S-methyltransferase